MACNYLHGTMAGIQVVSYTACQTKLKSLLLPLAQNCCACVQQPSVGPAKHTQELGMCMPQLKLILLDWMQACMSSSPYSSWNTLSKLLCLPAKLIVPGRTSLSSARMVCELLCYLSAAIRRIIQLYTHLPNFTAFLHLVTDYQQANLGNRPATPFCISECMSHLQFFKMF